MISLIPVITTAILGSCTITQAHISEFKDTRSGGFLQDKLDNQNLREAVKYPTDCFWNCFLGASFLSIGVYTLRNNWIDIEQQRQKDIVKCNKLENPDEQAKCIEQHEMLAKRYRKRCYVIGTGIVMTAVLVVGNVYDNCFYKEDDDFMNKLQPEVKAKLENQWALMLNRLLKGQHLLQL